MVDIPERFSRMVAGRPDWADWFAGLPRLLTDLLAEWQLRVDGPTASGECAVVVPVLTSDGRDGALKVGWPHWEAEHEHLALRAWAGRGAVELWRADPHRHALLLERADATCDLSSLPVLEACRVVGGLYPRLHRPAPASLRRLSELCSAWSERMPALETTGLAPRRHVRQATSLLRRFADDPDTDGTIVHTDLHYSNVLAGRRDDNVLAGGREPWLVIDPKPLSGDPGYEVAPLLWNRWDEVAGTGSIRNAVLDRFHAVVDAAGLEEDRARDWVVVREMLNVLWAHEDQRDRAIEVSSEWVTRATTIVKAIQR